MCAYFRLECTILFVWFIPSTWIYGFCIHSTYRTDDFHEKCFFIMFDTETANIFSSQIVFRPFSFIFFIETKTKSVETVLSEKKHLSASIEMLWMCVFVKQNRLINALTKSELILPAEKEDLFQFYGNFLQHPFLNTSDTSKKFVIGFYNYSPNVIITDDAKGQRYVSVSSPRRGKKMQTNHRSLYPNNRFDGIEYKLIQNILKNNWKIVHHIYNPSVSDPYKLIIGELVNRTIDAGLCSIWLNLWHYRRTELTTYYDQSCLTFLVPTPKSMYEMTLTYNTFSRTVGALTVFCFLLTALTLTLFGLMHESSGRTDIVFHLMELLSILTSHGSYCLRFTWPQRIVMVWWVTKLVLWLLFSFYFRHLCN